MLGPLDCPAYTPGDPPLRRENGSNPCHVPVASISDCERKQLWKFYLDPNRQKTGKLDADLGTKSSIDSIEGFNEGLGEESMRSSCGGSSSCDECPGGEPPSIDVSSCSDKTTDSEPLDDEPSDSAEPSSNDVPSGRNDSPNSDELSDSEGLSKCDESYENVSLRNKISSELHRKRRGLDSKLRLGAEDLDFLVLDDLKPHADESQVMLDVKRLFTLGSQFRMNGKSSYTTILSVGEVNTMRRKLYFLIVHMLRKHPCLHYYQGYHDIASVVLQIYGNEDESFKVLELLTLYHLRDYMLRDISLTINHLKLIPVVLENSDPLLFELIRDTSLSYLDSDGLYYDYKFTPALLLVLTLFSHDISNLNLIARVWDFILSHRSVAASAYFYAAAIIQKKDSIMAALGGLSDVELALLHTLISPSNLFDDLTEADVESILISASSLILRFPLDSLPNSAATFKVWFEEYNQNSVLCTTSKLGSPSDMILHLESLSQIMQVQEEQLACETQHEAEMLSKALDANDSALTSSEEFEKLSLFSSGNVSSSVTSLTNSSIVKKLFSAGNDSPSHPHSNVFKFTICVGFAGILMHFLLRQGGWHLVSKFPRFIHHSLDQSKIAYSDVALMTDLLGGVCSNMRDKLARDSMDLAQIGLGTLKRNIHALANFN